MFARSSRIAFLFIAVLVGLPTVVDPPPQSKPQKNQQQKQAVPAPPQNAK